MTVGKDTYVSVVEADEFVRLHFKKFDEFRVFWDALDNGEKESYLIKSAEQIDSLTFTGRKNSIGQPMQFPRNGVDIPQPVKAAAVYNALGQMNSDLKAAMNTQINSLQSLGVLINLRESGAISRATVKNTYDAQVAYEGAVKKQLLASKTAEEQLRPFMYGGFSIR